MEHGNEDLWMVYCWQGGISSTGHIIRSLSNLQEHRKQRGAIEKMNANVKDFEAELLAQAEDALRRTTQLSPEAEVVTATAL